ncbi:MAG: metal-dependent hydrolase [Acidobacteriaceae bacterium]
MLDILARGILEPVCIPHMEPVTHLMTGACLARAGFNRKAAYATVAMTLAAELPDLDTLWSFDGPIAGFQHHRGITHTLVGVPFEGLAVVGAVWLVHRWRLRRAQAVPAPPSPSDPTADQPIHRALTPAPVRWALLYAFVLVALASHLLLDWTNNYGVRPFFPFNPQWYAGSFVFIFEPVLFGVLLAALVVPALFGLIGSEVGAGTPVFRGRRWAIFALIAMVCLWEWRWVEHDDAVQLASAAAYGPDKAGAEVLRVTANPYPGNPYRWHTVVETPGFYQVATVDSLRSAVVTDPEQDIFYKPPATPDTLVARRTLLGEVYLDWSSWPLVTDVGLAIPKDAPAGAPEWNEVTFRDLRFMYDTALIEGRSDPPLAGAVFVDANRRVARMELGGRSQK